jgi:hypothetical protein
MKRLVEPEWLDVLPPDDPDAVRSRRDLCRVNAWMRHHNLMAGSLQNHLNGSTLGQIIELGAGDGNFLLRVAQKISARHPNVNTILLDRQNIVQPHTLSGFTALGWRAEAITVDVFDWSRNGSPTEAIIANLFLHHFYNGSLAGLFHVIAARASLFIALEPRRAFWPLLCSRLLVAIGCNRITRHDAAVSVRAGFDGDELSRLWPSGNGWQLTEQSVGSFSHLFIARRIKS